MLCIARLKVLSRAYRQHLLKSVTMRSVAHALLEGKFVGIVDLCLDSKKAAILIGCRRFCVLSLVREYFEAYYPGYEPDHATGMAPSRAGRVPMSLYVAY